MYNIMLLICILMLICGQHISESTITVPMNISIFSGSQAQLYAQDFAQFLTVQANTTVPSAALLTRNSVQYSTVTFGIGLQASPITNSVLREKALTKRPNMIALWIPATQTEFLDDSWANNYMCDTYQGSNSGYLGVTNNYAQSFSSLCVPGQTLCALGGFAGESGLDPTDGTCLTCLLDSVTTYQHTEGFFGIGSTVSQPCQNVVFPSLLNPNVWGLGSGLGGDLLTNWLELHIDPFGVLPLDTDVVLLRGVTRFPLTCSNSYANQMNNFYSEVTDTYSKNCEFALAQFLNIMIGSYINYPGSVQTYPMNGCVSDGDMPASGYVVTAGQGVLSQTQGYYYQLNDGTFTFAVTSDFVTRTCLYAVNGVCLDALGATLTPCTNSTGSMRPATVRYNDTEIPGFMSDNCIYFNISVTVLDDGRGDVVSIAESNLGPLQGLVIFNTTDPLTQYCDKNVNTSVACSSNLSPYVYLPQGGLCIKANVTENGTIGLGSCVNELVVSVALDMPMLVNLTNYVNYPVWNFGGLLMGFQICPDGSLLTFQSPCRSASSSFSGKVPTVTTTIGKYYPGSSVRLITASDSHDGRLSFHDYSTNLTYIQDSMGLLNAVQDVTELHTPYYYSLAGILPDPGMYPLGPGLGGGLVLPGPLQLVQCGSGQTTTELISGDYLYTVNCASAIDGIGLASVTVMSGQNLVGTYQVSTGGPLVGSASPIAALGSLEAVVAALYQTTESLVYGSEQIDQGILATLAAIENQVTLLGINLMNAESETTAAIDQLQLTSLTNSVVIQVIMIILDVSLGLSNSSIPGISGELLSGNFTTCTTIPGTTSMAVCGTGTIVYAYTQQCNAVIWKGPDGSAPGVGPNGTCSYDADNVANQIQGLWAQAQASANLANTYNSDVTNLRNYIANTYGVLFNETDNIGALIIYAFGQLHQYIAQSGQQGNQTGMSSGTSLSPGALDWSLGLSIFGGLMGILFWIILIYCACKYCNGKGGGTTVVNRSGKIGRELDNRLTRVEVECVRETRLNSELVKMRDEVLLLTQKIVELETEAGRDGNLSGRITELETALGMRNR